MPQAWIAGKPATLEAAIVEAARLLRASRLPLIAGLGTDVAGARAAIALAERAGAAIDHMHSGALLRELDVMRSSGVTLTTPGETAVRADTLLFVGTGVAEAWAATQQKRRDGGAGRRVFRLCPGRSPAPLGAGATAVTAVGKKAEELPAVLAVLRAHIAGRPTGEHGPSAKALREIAAELKAARFGVAIWSAATLDALAIEMLCGLVNDLNATTRFSALPLPPADNAVGVLQTCGWMTGMPMRTGFGRGFPEHDPWLFDGRRLAQSGEADCVVWISAYGTPAPQWAAPTIALTRQAASTTFAATPRVCIEVGCPGVDYAGVEYLPQIGTLAHVEAAKPSEAVSAANVIARLASALFGDGAWPC